MAKFKGWVGNSYVLRNSAYDCQRVLNLFPEVHEVQLGKGAEVMQFSRTPGLSLLALKYTGSNTGNFTLNRTGNVVTFTDTSTDCPNSTHHVFWDFGDDTTSTELNPVHTY